MQNVNFYRVKILFFLKELPLVASIILCFILFLSAIYSYYCLHVAGFLLIASALIKQ
jgi:hypothetical protein